jgi:hypothetical protein
VAGQCDRGLDRPKPLDRTSRLGGVGRERRDLRPAATGRDTVGCQRVTDEDDFQRG